MRKILVAVAALVMLVGVQSAKAWGGFGHSAIVYVAEQHLTPEAKAKCRYYLRHTLPYYASWMDQWRTIPEFKSVNNPHSIKAKADGRTIDWGGNPKGRAMGHLVNMMAELGNGKYKNLPDSLVRQRLINLVHYLPDLHCPVHVGFPKETYPQYRYSLLKKGKEFKYHTFWDGSPAYKRKKWTLERYAETVDHVTPKQAKKWVKGTYDDWASDIIRQAHRCYAITPEGTDITKMTKEQQAQVLELADEMAMKAAYRLAFILNTLFKE